MACVVSQSVQRLACQNGQPWLVMSQLWPFEQSNQGIRVCRLNFTVVQRGCEYLQIYCGTICRDDQGGGHCGAVSALPWREGHLYRQVRSWMTAVMLAASRLHTAQLQVAAGGKERPLVDDQHLMHAVSSLGTLSRYCSEERVERESVRRPELIYVIRLQDGGGLHLGSPGILNVLVCQH